MSFSNFGFAVFALTLQQKLNCKVQALSSIMIRALNFKLQALTTMLVPVFMQAFFFVPVESFYIGTIIMLVLYP